MAWESAYYAKVPHGLVYSEDTVLLSAYIDEAAKASNRLTREKKPHKKGFRCSGLNLCNHIPPPGAIGREFNLPQMIIEPH